MESEKIIIGSIEEELNLIRQRFREKKETSESYIRYYKQIEQPTRVKKIGENILIPFDNNLYFGGYWNHLNRPFVNWNGFYIQPFKYKGLMNSINEGKIFHNGKIVTDINEIKDYIITYREGFKLGYKYFDEIEIKNKSGILLSDERSIKRIADYVENNFSDFNCGFTYSSYHSLIDYWKGKSKCKFRLENKTCSRIKGEQPINICELCDLRILPDLKEWEKDGLRNGKFYRAWFYILSNTDLFDKYFNKTLQPQPDSRKEDEQPVYLTDLFEHTSKYQMIMRILAENGYIEPNTHIWKDKENKKFLASMIKDLHYKGYYKENNKPANKTIVDICKNTFGVNISIETVKRANYFDTLKSNGKEVFIFSFIPIASTLK
jgi:hypothetical protein